MKRLTARINVHIVLVAVVTSFLPQAAQAACFAETMAVATFGFERIPGDQTARQVYEIRKSQANSALASCERADRNARKLAKDYAAAQAASASAQREVEAEIARAQENAASAASNRENNRALLGVISAMVRDGQCQDAKITALNAGRMDLADQAMRLCVPAPASAAAKPPAVSSVPSRRDTKSALAAASASQPPVSAASTATLAPERKGDARDLGTIYASGRGVAQDALGFMYYNGTGVAQDYAAYELGMMYLNGTGVPRDDAAAVSWFRKAAEQGYASAQNNLGLMYSQGQGVAQDYMQAYKWHYLASVWATDAKARDTANKNKNLVAAKMQPAQIAEAQRLASAWRKK
jgi:hypothetical protein